MKGTFLICGFSIYCLTLCAATAFAQQDVETRAMQDEMKRSMTELHLEGMDPPYFISYKITDTDRKEADASMGALIGSSETHSRTLIVSVRAGNYQSDSSGFASNNFLAGNTVLPLDDNYDELRRHIWIATDAAYKKAVEDLAGKRAELEKRNRTDNIADFSKEPARQESDIQPRAEVKMTDAEEIVRTTSAEFLKLPAVETGDAHLEVVNTTEHYLNSEGTTYLRQVPEVAFHASASVQRETGQTLTDSVSEFGCSMQDLPNEAGLAQETAQLAQYLSVLDKKARSAAVYNGPVLFEGMAAAELFSHEFANQLPVRPATVGGGNGANAMIAMLMGGPALQASGNNLLNRIGSRVLPDFVSVVDNPSLATANGVKLLGGYKFDEEGTPSQKTTLVKDGILKTLLTSRTPVRGIDHSSGNMRERGVSPGNIFLTASKTSTLDQMKQQMLDIVKTRGLEYGMEVRRLANGNNAIEAYRVYPDGREVLVRNGRVTDMNYSSFKDILAVSDTTTTYTTQSGAVGLLQGLFGGSDFVTYVVPALLFEDCSLEHHSDNTNKATVIPSPN